MSARVIRPGGLIRLDPSDIKAVVFDWDAETLPTSVTISSSTFTITVLTQNGATILTKDNPAILTAAEATTALERTVSASSRATRIRLDATTATLGDRYQVANKIVTNESPSQTLERSFNVLVETR